MSTELYYTPPSDEIFDELKTIATILWHQYQGDSDYLAEKLRRIGDIQNVSDNFMYMVAMFDFRNQMKLSRLLSDETRKAVSDRLVSGGQPNEFNVFKN